MPAFLDGFPFVLAWLIMAAGARARGQMVFWMGRGAAAGARKMHVNLDKGRATIQRWGIVAVPFAYLTVGLQSLIFAAAGAMGIKWLRFTLACIPGAIAWGLIYSTIGWAVWRAFFFEGITSWWFWTVVVVLVGLWFGVVRTRRERHPGGPTAR